MKKKRQFCHLVSVAEIFIMRVLWNSHRCRQADKSWLLKFFKGGFFMIQEQFEKAAKEIHQITKRPSNDELLQLYALFKQSTEGDVTGSRPGMLDLKGRAKFDAWAKVKGKSKESCQKEYINLVETLKKKYA
jgi:acyl-CoA-binding protein